LFVFPKHRYIIIILIIRLQIVNTPTKQKISFYRESYIFDVHKARHY